jgi:hypothetical protein
MYLYGEGPLQYYFDNPLHNTRAKALYLKNSGKEVPASPNEVVEINRRPGLCPLIQITPGVSLYISLSPEFMVYTNIYPQLSLSSEFLITLFILFIFISCILYLSVLFWLHSFLAFVQSSSFFEQSRNG